MKSRFICGKQTKILGNACPNHLEINVKQMLPQHKRISFSTDVAMKILCGPLVWRVYYEREVQLCLIRKALPQMATHNIFQNLPP